MTDKTHLEAELRAVREELARREHNVHLQIDQASLVAPARDIKFARLKELTEDQLEQHETRLERDIEDLKVTNPNQLYRPATTDTEPAGST